MTGPASTGENSQAKSGKNTFFKAGQEIVTTGDKMSPLSYSIQEIPHLCPRISGLWISWHSPLELESRDSPAPGSWIKSGKRTGPQGDPAPNFAGFYPKIKPTSPDSHNLWKKELHLPHLRRDKVFLKFQPGKLFLWQLMMHSKAKCEKVGNRE